MYVCVCARVRECEVHAAILGGARSEPAVAEACGAGTGCGSCVDRIRRMVESATAPGPATLPSQAGEAPALANAS